MAGRDPENRGGYAANTVATSRVASSLRRAERGDHAMIRAPSTRRLARGPTVGGNEPAERGAYRPLAVTMAVPNSPTRVAAGHFDRDSSWAAKIARR